MYYSLIDDLAFLLNSLPPYNGAITASGSLFAITPVIPGAPVAPSCGPGVPTPCTTYAPQGVQQDAKTPSVQEWNLSIEQQLSFQHGSASRLCRIVWNSRAVERGPEQYFPADLRRRNLHRRRHRNHSGKSKHSDAGPAIHSRGQPARILIWARASSGSRKATAATTLCKST